tara:strand:+ start:152 stop:430 length:279 start_codon:yes stop_codon:yes gene_type:complete
MGGRVMGISTAYPNDPVIAGLLKKRRQQGLPKISTFLWISCRKTGFSEIQSTTSGGSAAQTNREALHLLKRRVMGIAWLIPPFNGGFFCLPL